MPTHLYCLLAAASEATPPGAVRALTIQDVVAWVASTDALTLSRDARDVARATLEHDRVVNAALSTGTTPIPASLADAYADDEAVMRDVHEHIADVNDALQRVRGLVEMTVIVAVTDAPPAPDVVRRGRAYLEQLRTRDSRASEIAAHVAAQLRPHFGEPSQRGDSGTLALSHLVERDRVASYRSLTLALMGEGYRIVIDGPRAPYSFARFSPRRGIFHDGPASAA